MDSNYWDNIYRSKSEREVSWFQECPEPSLKLIAELGLEPDDSIIDIGGGESRLVDNLLKNGFRNISVLDISATAIDKTKTRLGNSADFVKFIASDIVKFNPMEQYKLWHDRAAFHFLTKIEDIENYLVIAARAVSPGGYLIVSTFSKNGPEKCSGLPITQYSDVDLKGIFSRHFSNIKCLDDVHSTPWGVQQSFVYCGFSKLRGLIEP